MRRNLASVADPDMGGRTALHQRRRPRLEADLESGEWDRRYGQLRSLPELDLGHRIIVAELALRSSAQR